MSLNEVITQFCSQTNPKYILIEFVTKCCEGLGADPKKVIDGLLDEGNEQEIIRGEISEEGLRIFIQMWLKDGMPYVSGKVAPS